MSYCNNNNDKATMFLFQLKKPSDLLEVMFFWLCLYLLNIEECRISINYLRCESTSIQILRNSKKHK